MLARISTTFDCTAEQLWGKINRTVSLRFGSAPVWNHTIRFHSLEAQTLMDTGRNHTLMKGGALWKRCRNSRCPVSCSC